MKSSDEIVPISSLFFDGAGPHVVRAGFPSQSEREPKYTPARGHELQALLNTSIVKLGAVSGENIRKTPVRPMPAVPIESLLYKGRAALDRALEVRHEILQGGSEGVGERVEELLDLVALAAAE
jgi:hypothetical protein